MVVRFAIMLDTALVMSAPLEKPVRTVVSIYVCGKTS
jgi:hypothetical protein